MNAKVIVINGKTYHSVDEMPPDIRQKYEQAMSALGDADGNHLPDAFETLNIFADQNKNGAPDILENITAENIVMNSMKIIIDGKEFNGMQDLPPEARARYEDALSKLDANRNGIPDFIEGMINTTNQTTNVSTSFGGETTSPTSRIDYPASEAASPDKPLPVEAGIASDAADGWRLVLAGAFVFLLCVAGAAGVWYFFLR